MSDLKKEWDKLNNMKTITINIDDKYYDEIIKELDKFILDYPNSSYQVISSIPNNETLEAMKDVETGENYENTTLQDLEPPTK